MGTTVNYPKINIKGRQLEYCLVGRRDAQGPVLVFLHEGLGCIAMWRDFPQTLCNALGLRGFIYSRAGYGGSDGCELPRLTSFMHVEGRTVLPLVLEAAGITEAILIGHSDGASIALLAAASDTSRSIRALVTLSAHVFNEEICIQSIKAAKTAYEQGDLRQRLEKYHGGNVDNAFRGWCDVWLHREFRDWNLEEFLPAINVPSLVIQGANDAYGTPAQMAAITAGIGPAAKSHILADCGHNPHLEQAQITTELICGFVGEVVK